MHLLFYDMTQTLWLTCHCRIHHMQKMEYHSPQSLFEASDFQVHSVSVLFRNAAGCEGWTFGYFQGLFQQQFHCNYDHPYSFVWTSCLHHALLDCRIRCYDSLRLVFNLMLTRWRSLSLNVSFNLKTFLICRIGHLDRHHHSCSHEHNTHMGMLVWLFQYIP